MLFYMFSGVSILSVHNTMVNFLFSHLSFVVTNGGVHLLLVDVLDLGGGTAQDALLLLLGQRLCYHLDRLGPLVPRAGNR